MRLRVSDLPTVDGPIAPDGSILYDDGGTNGTARLTLKTLTATIAASLAPERVLEKCGHCGQWGAIMCACRYCGAPIDPQ